MAKRFRQVLLSGHHANVDNMEKRAVYHPYSQMRRPDLLPKADLTNKEWNRGPTVLRKQWKAAETEASGNNGAVYENIRFLL